MLFIKVFLFFWLTCNNNSTHALEKFLFINFFKNTFSLPFLLFLCEKWTNQLVSIYGMLVFAKWHTKCHKAIGNFIANIFATKRNNVPNYLINFSTIYGTLVKGYSIEQNNYDSLKEYINPYRIIAKLVYPNVTHDSFVR